MEPQQELSEKDKFILSRLLYRDALILVIDKPAGIPVHKGSGGGENLEQYFEALRFGLPRLPSLAHRLDKDTSGCLVLGRHRQALAKMSKIFENNRAQKIYWAIVHGTLTEQQGVIDAPLAKRSEKSYHWQMQVAENGIASQTEYRVLGSNGEVSWLELKPITGRTHQLRVHTAHIGHLILGDKIYGKEDGYKLHLHAQSITLPLYHNKDPLTVTAPPPEHMLLLLASCGNR